MAKSKKQFNQEYYERHREKICAKRKAYRAIYGQKQYGYDQKRIYWRRWYTRNAALCLGKKRLYSRTPAGVQGQLRRLYRFIENHPEISERYLEFCERMIKANERTIGVYGL